MSSEDRWVEAEQGYALALRGGKLVCRNKKGKELASVPAKVKKGETGKRLLALRDWLKEHDRECRAAVESWMLRSLPTPRAVLEAVWPDPAWREHLEHAVVVPLRPDGAGWTRRDEEAGFLRGVEPERGVGLVDLDGESVWLQAEMLALPHPVLLAELDDLRELLAELGCAQGIDQLFRQTFHRPDDAEGKRLDDFAEGKFGSLGAAFGRARSLGFQVRGGFAVCGVWEGGAGVEARYWVGEGDPYSETWTGELLWVDEKEKLVPIPELGPVAYSEGVRMASLIYAGRTVDEGGGE